MGIVPDDEATVSYPVTVYVFHGEECRAAQTIGDEGQTLNIPLTEGTYSVYAIGGASASDYVLPDASDVLTTSAIALREGHEHGDLMMDAGILRIEKHDDRLCFRNPGLLKLPVETIYRGGNSKARNPKIQNMLRMIGLGENVGSGFPKIIAAWKETNWGEPQLLNKLDVDEVELVLPVPSPNSSNVGLSNELSIELPEGLSIRLSKELSKGLSETAATIFKMIYADNYMTRGDMAEKIGISVTAVQKHINKLKSLRFIERDGSTGHGNWKIVEP